MESENGAEVSGDVSTGKSRKRGVDESFSVAAKSVPEAAVSKTVPARSPGEAGQAGRGRRGTVPGTGRGLLKTGHPEKRGEKSPAGGESKYRRVARFMVLIGSEEASKILSRLEPGQVEAVSREIVSLDTIGPEEAESVLEEFRSLLSPAYGYSGSSSGGIEEARRHLYAAFGPERGETLLVKAVPAAAENPFDFLTGFSAEQLSLLFREESPAASAMVFSRLPSKLSAAVLANIAPARKLEIVKRIARLGEVAPEVISRTAAALREKARRFGKSGDISFAGGEPDGKAVLAAILKHSGNAFGGRLLEELESSDPSLGRELKDRLYTLDDIAAAADRPIQEKLKTMDDREIALLIRDRPEAFVRKITGNISSNRAARITEESEIMGPVPKVECEAVARDFLGWFRLNREEGRILMLSDEDVLV